MSAGPGSPEDRDLIAGEYVLGTLSRDERAAFEAQRAADPVVEASVRAWERRLAPLALAVPEMQPPPRIWQAIVAALPGAAANDNRIAALDRQVRRWRLTAACAGLFAASLAAFIVGGRLLEPPAPEGRYVAVVTSGGAEPALIVSVDTATGTAKVRPVAAQAPSGRSLELWYVGGGKPPRTLGLIGTASARVTLPADAGAAGEGVFAVSVEPPGGSPTGQPTGQVIYTGKLIRE